MTPKAGSPLAAPRLLVRAALLAASWLLLPALAGSSAELRQRAAGLRGRGAHAGSGTGADKGAGAGSGSGSGSGAGADAGAGAGTGAGVVAARTSRVIGGANSSAIGGGGAAAAGIVAQELSLAALLVQTAFDGNHDKGTPRAPDTVSRAVAQRAEQLDLNTALQVLGPPDEVVAMLRQSAGHAGGHGNAEAEKAIKVLNKMLFTSQARLDDKVIDCKEFSVRASRNMGQIQGDLARLGQQLANMARVMTQTMNNIDQAQKSAQSLKEEEMQQELAYNQARKIDALQYEKKKKDLAEAESILNLTMCKEGAQLLQHGSIGAGAGSGATEGADDRKRHGLTSTQVQACFRPKSHAGGIPEFRFADPRLQSSTNRLTPEAQRMLQLALDRAGLFAGTAGLAAALHSAGIAYDGRGFANGLEDSDQEIWADGSQEASSTAPGSQSGLSLAASNKTVGKERAAQAKAGPDDEDMQASKCVSLQPDCGALHDTFAMLWGELKDQVTESRAKLYHDDEAWEARRISINSQLDALATQQGVLQTDLAEATSLKSTLGDQQSAKQEEHRSLTQQMRATSHECETAIAEILFTEMCSAIRVRNELIRLNFKDVSIAKEVVDCQVSDWVPQGCSVPCDDTLEGGTQVLRREIVRRGSKWGQECPKLEYESKCNQVKCPIDCQVGEWSAFSKCTKECDGGVQGRSRQLITKPKYGGRSCDTLQESRPCNTGSCDRDCQLSDWTPWTVCSKVCGGGFSERQRDVRAAARGDGLCPSESSAQRWQKDPCNLQDCEGDEVCVANMDLVIAVDASGSLSQDGFEIVKTFTDKLVQRFRTRAYGRDGARIAVVQFGNGKLDSERVVSDALLISKLTNDTAALTADIKKMTWQKGLTNLAQALLKAKDVLTAGGRPKAQQVVLLVTDGRPSFKMQATQVAQKLRESGRLVVVHLQEYRKKERQDLLKGWASRPWQNNYVWIPGKDALHSNYDFYVNSALVEICPESESPSYINRTAKEDGYVLSRKGVTCGRGAVSGTSDSLRECKVLGESAGLAWKAFAFGDKGCEVYKEPCKEYKANATYNVYTRVKTEEDHLLGTVALHSVGKRVVRTKRHAL